MSFNPIDFLTTKMAVADISPVGLFYNDYNQVDFAPATITEVESIGGSEGGGERAEHVIEMIHPDHGTFYIRNNGYYYSYCGVEMDSNYREVFPRQVLRTEYTEEKEF